MPSQWVIRWSGRYGDPPSFCTVHGDESTRIVAPALIVFEGSEAQAEWIAARLSDWWPGQDYAFEAVTKEAAAAEEAEDAKL